jgi:hypothetical protein
LTLLKTSKLPESCGLRKKIRGFLAPPSPKSLVVEVALGEDLLRIQPVLIARHKAAVPERLLGAFETAE